LNFGPQLLNELLHVVLAWSDEYLELLVLVDVINVDDFNIGILGFLPLIELNRQTNHIEGLVFGRRVTALLADYLLFHQSSKQLAYHILWLLIEIFLRETSTLLGKNSTFCLQGTRVGDRSCTFSDQEVLEEKKELMSIKLVCPKKL
jgi:hypothetical protein